MNKIDKSFYESMAKICGRCTCKFHCEQTKTKCTEFEILSAMRDELNQANEVLETCDTLVSEIEKKEAECEKNGVCAYCGGKYGKGDIQVKE